jgi:glycosyltransferase involved in cell wall biosynthesis
MSSIAAAVQPNSRDRVRYPLIVVGITDPQTSLILRSRIRALRAAGFRVILVSGPGPLLDSFAAEEGVEAIAVPMKRRIAPLADLVSLARLWLLLHRLKPDMTEFGTPKAGLLGSIAAFLARVPVRVYLLRGLRLETAHGLPRRILLAAERLAARCSHVVLCNSRSLLAEAASLGLAPERKLVLAGEGSSCGVDTERFAPCFESGSDEKGGELRQRLGIAPDAPVVGFVGRLTRDKGVPELIEAFHSLLEAQPDARLLLVGWFDESEDALDENLRREIADHPSIIYTGFVRETAPWYRVMDVMVLPTWREGLPNAVLEAASSGVPVITTLATGSRDAVVPEVTGLLVPPGHPEAILQAMLTLLRDEPRRIQMGRAARQWVIEHFAQERVLESLVALYSGLLQMEETTLAADAVPAASESV